MLGRNLIVSGEVFLSVLSTTNDDETHQDARPAEARTSFHGPAGHRLRKLDHMEDQRRALYRAFAAVFTDLVRRGVIPADQDLFEYWQAFEDDLEDAHRRVS